MTNAPYAGGGFARRQKHEHGTLPALSHYFVHSKNGEGDHMPKTEEYSFEDFLSTVDPEYRGFVGNLHEYLMQSACKMKIEAKSSGYLVSYTHAPSKRVILNFVFRKTGLIVRIYGDHVNQYPAFIDTLPAGMLAAIAKAPVCKRLMDPNDCNPKCAMGYEFVVRGDVFKKCKYNCFMFAVNEESNPFIRLFVEREVGARVG